ncbi:hypothetical protein [Paraburkholderia youngii]|uniref:hypothetical protein n=1 Tax=Paraburkholderia youngii TaxID=2782701 RepID=UPI003D1DBB48
MTIYWSTAFRTLIRNFVIRSADASPTNNGIARNPGSGRSNSADTAEAQRFHGLKRAPSPTRCERNETGKVNRRWGVYGSILPPDAPASPDERWFRTAPQISFKVLGADNRKSPPPVSDGSASDVEAEFLRAEKAARRHAIRIEDDGEIPADTEAMTTIKKKLAGAMEGMEKMAGNTQASIKNMLLENNVEGLQEAANASGPLRSYFAGVRIGEHLLEEKYDNEPIPEEIRAALRAINALYKKSSKDFVALGRTDAYSASKPRSKAEVDTLMATFAEFGVPIRELRSKAMKYHWMRHAEIVE